jgi:hypothetical protein
LYRSLIGNNRRPKVSIKSLGFNVREKPPSIQFKAESLQAFSSVTNEEESGGEGRCEGSGIHQRAPDKTTIQSFSGNYLKGR